MASSCPRCERCFPQGGQRGDEKVEQQCQGAERTIPLTDEQIGKVMGALTSGEESDLISTGQAARLLGVTPVTVRRLLDSGRIPYARLFDGGKRLILRRDVLEYQAGRFASGA